MATPRSRLTELILETKVARSRCDSPVRAGGIEEYANSETDGVYQKLSKRV